MKYFSILLFSFCTLISCTKKTDIQTDKNGYSYKTVAGDPQKARIYTLENGLKVYLSVYKDEPRVQTYVAVAAGSKTDPNEATGLAHYLEHMMFKGTPKLGTQDWEKEKAELDKIESLYEKYRQTKEETERKAIYHQIDSVSSVAASYAIANEYDKATALVGAQGTNAYTFFEQTVYVNNIPSNQLEKWITLESERFSQMTPRLFHTELEAVYEEKNRALDNDGRKVWELLLSSMFQKHTYGTQTTIGTIDHLKNPSITEIKKYFATYYVPNNMAICLSGDLDPEATIQAIDKAFKHYERKPIPAFTYEKEAPITSIIEKEVVGPTDESVLIGFRFPGIKTKESLMMELVSMLLSNSEAGLIDLNLNQKQKVLGAYSYPLRLSDYSIHMLSANPNKGQSLADVEALLISQLDSLKEGNFPDWLIGAVVNDYKKSLMTSLESNDDRADNFVTAFIHNIPWEDYIKEIDLLEKVTKAEVQAFVKEHYNQNYVRINKLQGTDENTLKVEKPNITPVPVNREAKSDFFSEWSTIETPSISPKFLDFKKELSIDAIKGKEFIYKKNEENELFELIIDFDKGDYHDKRHELAIDYLSYLGTEKMNATELSQAFYKLGCSFSVSSDEKETSVSLSGLAENMDEGLRLLIAYINAPKEDEVALQNLKEQTLKSRENQRLDKRAILQRALVSYAKYGKENPFKYGLTAAELENVTSKELITYLNELFKHTDRIIYYGPEALEKVKEVVVKHHSFHEGVKKPEPIVSFSPKNIEESIIYYVPYDMVQAEVVMLSSVGAYDPSYIPQSSLYNEYFGGNMGSVVFQELRESKALAYSVRSYFSNPSDTNKLHYSISYIGTQADKLKEAMNGMLDLLDNIPRSSNLFSNSKESLTKSIESSRITKGDVISAYLQMKEFDRDYSMREKVYNFSKNASLDDVINFHNQYIKNKPKAFLLIGAKDKIDFKELSIHGKIVELSLDDIFIN